MELTSVKFTQDAASPEVIDMIIKENCTEEVNLCQIALPDQAEKWRDLICQLKTLKTLGLMQCTANNTAMDMILDGLQQNNSITMLRFYSIHFDNEQFLKLTKIIISKPQITELILNSVPFDGVQQTEALANVIKTNQLRILAIHNNSDNSSSTHAILDALQYAPSLSSLTVRMLEDSLGDDAGVALGKWIEQSTAVKYLQIIVVSIDEHGFKSFMNGLLNNSSLKQIYLSVNSMTDAACESLCQAIKINESLQNMDIVIKYMEGKPYLSMICDALAENVSLTRFSFFTCTRLTSDVKQPNLRIKFEEMLKINEVLTDVTIEIDDDFLMGEIYALTAKNEALRDQLNKERLDLLILIHNIVRSDEVFQRLPSEIWLSIFSQLRIRNWKMPQTAKQLCKLYKRCN